MGLAALLRLLAGDVVTRELAPCGTDAGYQTHRRSNEDACDPCLAAHNARTAAQRRDPANLEYDRIARAARQRALWRLAREHRDRYRQLVVEEMVRGAAAKGGGQ